ncbi:MAG: outer membrane lipid asymmetry maintenance protein MlaD [Pseudomonadota bacterium]|nr:MAG: outer membrane lipid asymmetry maintenance protein MlaD [Pseudomonadota bacterium]
MNSKALELWVGIFVAAGVAALAMLAFKVGNLSTVEVQDAYTIKGRFDNIGGLKVKAPVTMAGVRIGRVADISFDNSRYQAVVSMSIDGRYQKIPNDTSASILTSGLLGEQYVGLEVGGAEEFLKNGDSLQLTQSALVLEKMIGQFLYSQASKDK